VIRAHDSPPVKSTTDNDLLTILVRAHAARNYSNGAVGRAEGYDFEFDKICA